MAFNFNAINDELQQKANIFAPTETGQTVAGSPEGQAAPSGGQNSGGTSVNLSSGSSSAPGAPPPNPKGSGSGGASNPAATQAAYDAMGPSSYTDQTQAIGSKISGANDKLQAEANAYTQKADTTAQGYKISDEQIQGAANGDEANFKTVASRLSKTQPDQFEAFKGLSDDEIPTAASAISKPTNFGDIYAQSAGPNYSTGANRINSMQLRRSGDFRNIAMQLGRQNQDLLESNNTQQTDLTNSTRANLANVYGTETANAKSQLKGMGDQVIKAAQFQEQADEERRRNLDLSQISAAEYAKLKPDQLAQLQAQGLGYNANILDQKFDLSPYAKINTDVNYTDFLDNQGASKFNRIQSLLGSNSPILAHTQAKADYDFNTQGANDFIRGQVTTQGKAQDERLNAERDALLAEQGQIRKQAQDAEVLKAQQEAERQAAIAKVNAARSAATTGQMAPRKPNAANNR